MKNKIIITIMILIVVLILGFKAINSWVYIEQTKRMFELDWGKGAFEGSCKIDRGILHCDIKSYEKQ